MQPTSSETSSRRSPSSREIVALAAWLALAAGIGALAFSARGETPEDVFYSYELALAGLVGGGILVGVSFALASLYRERARALGFSRFSLRWLWIAFGVVGLAVVVSAALEPVLHAGEEQGLTPQEWRPERAGVFVLNAAVAVLVAPFSEELFFRGLGVHALRLLGGFVAVAGSAVAFACAHGIVAALPPLLVLGVGLGWLRLRSGSVFPAMIAHGTYNSLAVSLPFVVPGLL